MTRISTAFAACALLVSSFGAAADSPVVVELYTSQGCYSCPPADKLLHQMSGDDTVIPLALHVDYWDYIGWKDSFAHSAFSERQRSYARHAGRRAVYTPQMIVNGTDAVVGNRPMEVAEHVRRHAMKEAPVALDITRTGNRLSVRATANTPVRPADVTLIRYLPEAKVDIRRGENAGKTLTYSNIVTEWTVVGQWTGAEALDAEYDLTGDDPVVIIIQERDYGPVLAAARLR